MNEVYRLILFVPRPGLNYPEGGSYDTGATYPNCNQSNTAPCDPQQFAHVEDAIRYAKSKNEIPVRVANEMQVWSILNGQTPITDDMVISGGGLFDNPMMLAAVGIGALFVLPKLLKKRGNP